MTKPSTPFLHLHPHIDALCCAVCAGLMVFHMSQSFLSFWAGGGQTQPGVKESQAHLLGCGQREPNHRLCSASLQGQVTNAPLCQAPNAEFILTFAYSPRPASHEFAAGYLDTEDWSERRSAAYASRSDVFTSDLETERSELTSRKEAMRQSAERISLNKRVSGARIYGSFSGHQRPGTSRNIASGCTLHMTDLD